MAILSFLDEFFITAALLGMSAFYSGAETALVSASRARLEALAEDGKVDAKRAISLIERTPSMLATVLVGTNLGNIGASSFVTALAMRFSPENGAALATILLTPVVLFFAEILPKALFRSRATRLLRGSSAVLVASEIVLAPLAKLASGTTTAILRVFGVPPEQERPAFRREDLEAMFLFGAAPPRTAQEAAERKALRMAGNALVLSQRTATDAMRPLPEEQTVRRGATVGEATKRFLAAGVPTLAVVDDEGSVEGFVAVKQLLGEAERAAIPMRSAWSIDPDEPLDEVIQGFRRHQQSIGIVRDREGKTLGVVSAEDVFEEVVGELTGQQRHHDPKDHPAG